MGFFKTKEEKELVKYSGHKCKTCGKPLSVNVAEFSTKFYGDKYCITHQRELDKINKS